MSQESIVIVGLGPQGLYLLREYARLGYRTYAVGSPNDIAYHSRYGEKIEILSEQDLKKVLLGLKSKIEGEFRCIITSGFFLSYIVRELPEFFEKYAVSPGPCQDLELLMNKEKTYSLAESSGLHTIHTRNLAEINLAEIDQMDFPLILKWSQDNYVLTQPPFKTKVVRTSEQLAQIIDSTKEEDKEHLIAQEYLGSDLTQNFSFGGYYINGELQVGLAINEARHIKSGISSYVKEVIGEMAVDMENNSKRLIGNTNFTGFLDVEFKLSRGNLYLLEVNPRPFGFIKIFKAKYPNLIDCIERNDFTKLIVNKKNCHWRNVLRDTIALFKLIAKGRVLEARNLIYWPSKRYIRDVWDLKDIKPFFHQIIKSL